MRAENLAHANQKFATSACVKVTVYGQLIIRAASVDITDCYDSTQSTVMCKWNSTSHPPLPIPRHIYAQSVSQFFVLALECL